MKKIIYSRPDGGLSVVHPVINTHTVVDGQVVAVAENISEEQALERAKKDVPADAANVQIVDASAIPADRTFRNAWKATPDGKIEHDMDKAREIQKQRLREIRAPLLESLDVDFMQALEKGDNAAASDVAKKKQQLRDVTDDPALTAATTVDQLKAVIPAVLKDKPGPDKPGGKK